MKEAPQTLKNYQIMLQSTGTRALMVGDRLYINFKGKLVGFNTVKHLLDFMKMNPGGGCGGCKE